MADLGKLPWKGGCRCGRIRIAVTEPPLLADLCACHCSRLPEHECKRVFP